MENLIEKYKDKLPASYLEFISTSQRFYGYIGNEFGYVDLWEIDFLSQVFDVICKYHDNLGKDYFPIGSDGGGNNIVIKLTSPKKELFLIESISTSDEYAIFFCDNFEKLFDSVMQYKLKNVK
ncbi:MAG: SMI1/KNR4 family protein [Chloroflexota bacterium]